MRKVIGLALALVACSGGGGGGAKNGGDGDGFPDEARVKAANSKWCAALQKTGEDGRWSYQKDCEASTPGGSADFIERLAACFTRQVEELGDQAPDGHSMLQGCTDEIVNNVDPGPLPGNALVQARCERIARCEKSSTVEECVTAFGRLDGAQRTLLVSMYNLRAQQGIAECLEETACAEDEDAVHGSCYQKPLDQRVWRPF